MNPLAADLRIGLGEDSHRLAPGGPLRLGGIELAHDFHLVGHSDADAVLHAVTDALLGAVGLPDLGEWFPNTDPAHSGRDSSEMLAESYVRVLGTGYRLVNLDLVIALERPRIASYKGAMRRRIAAILQVSPDQINCKAKTGEGVGSVGRCEAVSVRCIALLTRQESPTIQGDRH